MINPYVLIALISSILFGAVTIIQKRTAGIDSVTFSMVSLGAAFLSILLYWLFSPQVKSCSMSGLAHSLIAGAISGLAYLLFIIALRIHKVSTVVIINSFNAVIAVVLAMVLLRERLSVTQAVGIVLGVSGVVLVSL